MNFLSSSKHCLVLLNNAWKNCLSKISMLKWHLSTAKSTKHFCIFADAVMGQYKHVHPIPLMCPCGLFHTYRPFCRRAFMSPSTMLVIWARLRGTTLWFTEVFVLWHAVLGSAETIFFGVHTVVYRDCHGYTHGYPWRLKQAQEQPNWFRNDQDMAKILFWPYLSHFLTDVAVLGLVWDPAGSHRYTCDNP